MIACAVCGEPFAREAHRDLHLGRLHPGAATAAEEQAYRRALAEEEAWLARVRRHVRGGLHALPMVLIWVVILILAIEQGVVHWALIPLPGIAVFVGLAYLMGWSERHTVEAD